ncbi:MAG TPA: P22 phage major capsid protein family protein, partial [Pyrinomonadaceae bacterium]
LLIDQAKYFNFKVDDIDKVQTNANVMAEAMSRAGYGLRDKVDIFIAASHILVPSANLLGTDVSPIVPTKADAYDYLVDLNTKLDEANVPAEGRFAIVPPWFEGLLLKDNRFVAAGTSKTDEVLRNGLIGRAAGFDIYKSNNTPNTNGTLYKVIAGHPMAYSFAEQIVKTEAYRPEKSFADAVKGMHVYGGKLVRPSAWVVGTFNKA